MSLDLSIVVPSIRPDYLRGCVESIKQVIPEAEVVVVSTSVNCSLAQELGCVFVAEPENFVSLNAVFNEGFRAATRDFVLWFNDDAKLLKLPDVDLDPDTLYAIGVSENEKAEKADYYVKQHIIYYPDFGLFSRALGARLGWWDDRYTFYWADTDFACKVWESGDGVEPLLGSLVYHSPHRDESKEKGQALFGVDQEKFFAKWNSKRDMLNAKLGAKKNSKST